jgi:hypothetical protein
MQLHIRDAATVAASAAAATIDSLQSDTILTSGRYGLLVVYVTNSIICLVSMLRETTEILWVARLLSLCGARRRDVLFMC